MSRPKMLPGTRPSKEMLSTRIPSYVYDRVREYAIRSRFSIEEITTEALTRLIDAEAPDIGKRFTAPEPAPAAAVAPTPADARIDALEAKLDRVLTALAASQPQPAVAGKRRHG